MPLENINVVGEADNSVQLVIATAAGTNRIVVAMMTAQHWEPANLPTALSLDGVVGVPLVSGGGNPDGQVAFAYYWLDAELPEEAGTYTVTDVGGVGTKTLSAFSASGAKQVAPIDAVGSIGYVVSRSATISGDSGFAAFMASVHNGGTVVIDNTTLVNQPGGNNTHAHSYSLVDGDMLHTNSLNEFDAYIAFGVEPNVDGPDQFNFNDDLNAPRSSPRVSNTITVAGLGVGVSVPFNVTGAGSASKNGSLTLVTSGTVANDDTLVIHHDSSANYSTVTSTTLDVNGVSDVFVTQTIAAPAGVVINGNNTVTEGAPIALESAGVTLTNATALYLRYGTRKVNQANITVLDADSATANHVLDVANVGVPFTTARHAIYCGITVAGVDHEVVVDHAPVAGETVRTVDPASMISGDGSLFKNIVAYFSGLSLATSINDQCVVPSLINSTATTWAVDGTGNMNGYVDQGPQTGTGAARYYLAANESWYDINFTLVDGQVDTIAPTLVSGPTITNITQTTADFAATPNDAGFYGLAVLPAATAVPAGPQILAGTVSGSVFNRAETAMTAGTPIAAAITGLQAGSAWRIHVALRDTAATPNIRVISSANFNTPGADSISPNFSAGPTVSSIAQTTAVFAATPDENGVYGLAVLPSASAAPSAPALIAGTVPGAVWSRASTAMTAAVQISANLSGMSQGQSYRIHAALQDAAGNSRVVTSTTFTMQSVGDTTAPNFTAGPGIANLQSTSFDVTFTADEAGQYRIVVLPSTALAPLANEVLSGTGRAGATPESVSALLSMSAAAAVSTPLTGLTPGGMYIPYVALRDATGNSRLANAGPVQMPIIPDEVNPTITISLSSIGLLHTITAAASDNVGVAGITFLINGQALGAELTIAPWQRVWNAAGYPAGNYSITAQARDAVNNTTLSNSVLVQIADQGLPDVAPVARQSNAAYEQRDGTWYRVEDKVG